MSHTQDIDNLEHAQTQIEYAKAGGLFTRRSNELLREAIQRLRRVIATERRRRFPE